MIIYLQIGLSITKTVESKKTSILGSIIGTILPSLIQLFLISMLINLYLHLTFQKKLKNHFKRLLNLQKILMLTYI